jgi:predicted peptidase
MTQKFIICFLIPILITSGIQAQKMEWPVGFRKDSVSSSLDKKYQKFYYYQSTATSPQPLIVSLHQWSADYSEVKNSLATETKQANWNYIHPDFRGANKRIQNCASQQVLQDIDDAVSWAVKHLPVDKSKIYIVGASGGGYAALAHFMKSTLPINTYVAYVPITDLESWYYESLVRQKKYAADILNCTGSGDTLDVEKARSRSPLFWKTPVQKLANTKVQIYAGVHDGQTGAVPITQSISFYNKLVNDIGDKKKDNYVTNDETIYLLTKRAYPVKTPATIGGRQIYLSKKSKNIALTIFEGSHEILTEAVIEKLK